jgi:hypothetical protein
LTNQYEFSASQSASTLLTHMSWGAAGLSSLYQEVQAQVFQASVRFDVFTRHSRAYQRSHSERLERITIAHLALKPHSPNAKGDNYLNGLDGLAYFHVDPPAGLTKNATSGASQLVLTKGLQPTRRCQLTQSDFSCHATSLTQFLHGGHKIFGACT